jgi:hypothetical protein
LNTLIKNSQATQNSQELKLKILDSRNEAVQTYKDSQFTTINPITAKIKAGEELTPAEATAYKNYRIGLLAAEEPYNDLLTDLFTAVKEENPSAAAVVDPSATAEDRAASFLAQ